MNRWPGSVVTKSPATPNGVSAPGIWTMQEAAYWTKRGLWPGASPDANWSYVAYLMSTTATNGGQNNTFLDSSTNNFTITRNGSVTQGAVTPYGTLWSNYFDGSGDYLSIPNNAAFSYGTGDFTMEAWVYKNGSGSMSVVDSFTSGGGTFGFSIQDTTISGYQTSVVAYTFTYTVPRNTWVHIAFVRTGGNLTCYVNGTSVGSQANSANFASSNSIIVGRNAGSGGEQWLGYISNLRIVKGTAVYTANFTPPSSSLTAITNTSLLTCQSNRFRDASTNNFTVTAVGDTKVTAFSPFILPSPGYSTAVSAGSGYFNGSSYLTAPANAVYAFGTGDFTVECWINFSPSSAGGRITDRLPGGGASGTWGFNFSPTTFGFTEVVAGEPGVNASGLPNMTSTWTHLAACRSGSTLRLFANGVLVGSGTNTTNFNNSSYALCIGAAYETAITGYISNVRIVKGTALYTAAFTPPTTPVTAVSGTSILCNFTNANIYDASMNNNIDTVGNAQVSTTQVKFGTTSAYFDGSGDVLNSPAGLPFNFGTGDFTAEFWMYKTSSTAYQRILAYGGFTAAGNFQVEFTDDVTATIHINGGYITTTVPNVLNKWVFVAVTRQSGSVRVFTDGVLRSTNTQSGSVGQTNPFSVGAVYDASSPFTGYLDDVRITKGLARYTATFTPPAAPFPVY